MKEPLNYIAPDVEFEGKIDCEGSIRIDGTCRGVIDSKDSITIGNSARVFGTVRAQNLIVNGRVKGDLITNGRIAVLSEGEIEGKSLLPQVVCSSPGVVFFKGVYGLKNLRSYLLRKNCWHFMKAPAVIFRNFEKKNNVLNYGKAAEIWRFSTK